MLGRRKKSTEYGGVEVEAVFILPVAIICVCLLLCMTLILFQRAHLQQVLEESVILFKASMTDTYIDHFDEGVRWSKDDGALIGKVNEYDSSEYQNPYLNVHSSSAEIESAFETYFYSLAHNMILGKPQLEVKCTKNAIVSSTSISAVATQTVQMPIRGILDNKKEYTIVAQANEVVFDHDDLVKKIDYAVHLVNETEVGDFVKNAASKIVELYGKMKSALKM